MAKATTTQQNDFDAVFRALDSACTLPFASWCARTGGHDRIRLSVSPIWPEGEAATRVICPTAKSADGLTAAQYRFFYALFSSNWKEKDRCIALKRTLLPVQNPGTSATAKRALSNARGASLLLLDHGDSPAAAEAPDATDNLYAHVQRELSQLYLQYAILESERDLVLDICRDMQAHVKERLGKAILDHPKVELFTDKKYWYQFLPLEKSRSFDRTCNRIAQAMGVQGMAEADSELPLVTPRAVPSDAEKPPVPTLPKKADSLSSRSKHPESEAIKYNAKRLIMENLQDAASLLFDVRAAEGPTSGFNIKETVSVSGTWLWGFTQGNTSDDARRTLLAPDARDKWLVAGLLLADWLLDCAKGSDDDERLAHIQGAVDAIVERLDGDLSDAPTTGELAALYDACAPTLMARESLGPLTAGILYSLAYGAHLEHAGLGASSLQADIGTVWAAGDPQAPAAPTAPKPAAPTTWFAFPRQPPGSSVGAPDPRRRRMSTPAPPYSTTPRFRVWLSSSLGTTRMLSGSWKCSTETAQTATASLSKAARPSMSHRERASACAGPIAIIFCCSREHKGGTELSSTPPPTVT